MLHSSRRSTGHLLEAEGLSVRLPGEARPILEGLDLRLEPGAVAGVCGRSGAGKTTLLGALCGLVPWLRPAEMRGELRLDGESLSGVDPGQRAHLIGTCLDRPDAQLFLPTVAHELAAARRLHGGDALQRAAEALGVERLAARRITELSSGQRQRVALVAALAASPRPVLLDEPTAHLDADGVSALFELLAEAARRGASFLINEQAGWRLGPAAGRWLRLGDGRLSSCETPRPPVFARPGWRPGGPVLSASGLAVERNGVSLLSDLELELRTGEVVLLSGPNGAGKSTLARVLAGFQRPVAGALRREGRGALMLPSAELQLFAGTVAAEVASPASPPAETARVLRRHRLEHLAARAPWTLSRGERQRLVHAALDLRRPPFMIVDEPAQGLDPEDLEAFVELVHRRAAKGRAYLVISHRPELAGAVHRHLRIVDRRLEEVPA